MTISTTVNVLLLLFADALQAMAIILIMWNLQRMREILGKRP